MTQGKQEVTRPNLRRSKIVRPRACASGATTAPGRDSSSGGAVQWLDTLISLDIYPCVCDP